MEVGGYEANNARMRSDTWDLRQGVYQARCARKEWGAKKIGGFNWVYFHHSSN